MRGQRKNPRKAVQPFENKKRKIDIFKNYEANGVEKIQRKLEIFSTLISKKSKIESKGNSCYYSLYLYTRTIMARPRTLPDDHFCFSTFRKGDSTYVYGYRNEWDPEKKQSRIAKRIYVGTLNEITGRVKLGKKYLSNHPEYEGKTLYFENRTLVERSEQEVAAEVGQRETSWASNNLSYAATWALWQFASKNRILQNLQAVFGKQLGTNLLALAIYQLLDGGAMNGYEDWLPDNWLPVSAPLSSQRISELLAQVDHGDMVKEALQNT